MKIEKLRRQLIRAARAVPVSDHAPEGFEALVRGRISRCLRAQRPADVARAWLEGLGRAACLAGAIAVAVMVLNAMVPPGRDEGVDPTDEPDLLGRALLADVPGLLDDAFPEENIP